MNLPTQPTPGLPPGSPQGLPSNNTAGQPDTTSVSTPSGSYPGLQKNLADFKKTFAARKGPGGDTKYVLYKAISDTNLEVVSKKKSKHNEIGTGVSLKEYRQAHNSLFNKNGNSYIALNKAGRAVFEKANVKITSRQVQMSPQKNWIVPLNPPWFCRQSSSILKSSIVLMKKR